jgi:hypothetical protein
MRSAEGPYTPSKSRLRGRRTHEDVQKFRRDFTKRFEQKLIYSGDAQNGGDVTSDEIGENCVTPCRTCTLP